MLPKKGSKKKRFNKRLYIYMALVTMAVVSLFTKPIKKSFTTLEKYLSSASRQKTTLRKNLSASKDKDTSSVNNLLIRASSKKENKSVFKLTRLSRTQYCHKRTKS